MKIQVMDFNPGNSLKFLYYLKKYKSTEHKQVNYYYTVLNIK